MARGITRQILADIEHVAAHPSPVQVTRSPEADMVQVSISPAPLLQGTSMHKWVALGALIAGAAIILILMAAFSVPIFIAILILSGGGIGIVESYDRTRRAYIFRVSRREIVFASSGPLGPRNWELNSDSVADVRIRTGKKHLLVFDLVKEARVHRRRRRCRQRYVSLELQRDRLIEVANAVREGLGMPPGQWG